MNEQNPNPNPNQAPSPISPRQRMKELQDIPERQRTDAEWDELNELEIMLASGNREGAPDPSARRDVKVQQGGQQPKTDGGPRGRRPQRKFQKRPPKGGGPQQR
jgi:hypothetical protein